MTMKICGGGGGGGFYTDYSATPETGDGSWYDRHMPDSYRELVNEMSAENARELKSAICMTRPLCSEFAPVVGREDLMEFMSPDKMLEYLRPVVKIADEFCELKYDASKEDMNEFVTLAKKICAEAGKDKRIVNQIGLLDSDFREGLTEYVYDKAMERYNKEADVYEYLHTCFKNEIEVWIPC